ncbi:hypothetical protein [Roseateles sp. BYS96W]|uniref:Uncharacterized protein n=1 Tax=Pelomonas nitida TaxID=3299027 RepID=A0ABW7G7I0_9BURK
MPIKTWDTSGNVLFDSDAVVNGVCLGAYLIGAGTSFSRSFSLLAGATVRVMGLNGGTDLSGVTVSYPGSVPTVSATAIPVDRYVVLWATGTPTITSGAGIQAVGATDTVALSPAARGCNYIGKAVYVGTTASAGSPLNGGTLGSVSLRVTSPTPPVMVLGVTSGAYSRISRGPYSLGGNDWGVDVQSVASLPTAGASSWPALLTPDVYVFAAPALPGAGAQAAIYDTDGTLAYDLLAGRVLTSSGPLSYPAGSGVDDYSAALPAGISSTLCGAFGTPYYSEVRSAARGGQYIQRTYAAAWTLSGGSLYRFRTIVFTELDIDPLTRLNESSAVVEIVDLNGLT